MNEHSQKTGRYRQIYNSQIEENVWILMVGCSVKPVETIGSSTLQAGWDLVSKIGHGKWFTSFSRSLNTEQASKTGLFFI